MLLATGRRARHPMPLRGLLSRWVLLHAVSDRIEGSRSRLHPLRPGWGASNVYLAQDESEHYAAAVPVFHVKQGSEL